MYFKVISLVISSIFFGWFPTGTLDMPGKSMIVKSGHVWEYILSIKGSSIIFLLFPQVWFVNSVIFSFIMEKSVILLFISSSKYIYGSPDLILFNLNSIGLLVTTPSPLGKMSNPIILVNIDVFPVLWPPIEQILGILIYCVTFVLLKNYLILKE